MALAWGSAASAVFGVIALGLVCGLVGGVGFWCLFLSGDVRGGISKYLSLGFCHGCFLRKGISELCHCDQVLRYWRACGLGFGWF